MYICMIVCMYVGDSNVGSAGMCVGIKLGYVVLEDTIHIGF